MTVTAALDCAEDVTIGDCRGILARALKTTRQYRAALPPQARRIIDAAADDLHDACELYELIRDGDLHPGREWPDLEHEDEAYSIGLWRAGMNAAADAAYLTDLVGRYCGPAAAGFVSSEQEAA